MLRKRADFLGERINEKQGRTCTYDITERKALLWALNELGETDVLQETGSRLVLGVAFGDRGGQGAGAGARAGGVRCPAALPYALPCFFSRA